MVDPKKYVVLDIETNGLNAREFDLLSISIFDPCNGKIYNRYLPLEKNVHVYGYAIHGITKAKLAGAIPLDQKDIDMLIEVFDLDNRTILTYGDIDEKFLVEYFQRHNLKRINKFHFYNFKNDVIYNVYGHSSSKDSLCELLGIAGVKKRHSSKNDVILEWELFKTMDGNKLMLDSAEIMLIDPSYYVPVSKLIEFPTFKKMIRYLPNVSICSQAIFRRLIGRFEIGKYLRSFFFWSVALENLVYRKLGATRAVQNEFVKKNSTLIEKLHTIVKIEPYIYDFNDNGTLFLLNDTDERVEIANMFVSKCTEAIEEAVKVIKDEIFLNEDIIYQENIVNNKSRTIAICDFSSKKSILEVKTAQGQFDISKYKYQFYYEANGRDCYCLTVCPNKNIDYVKDFVDLYVTLYKVSLNTSELKKRNQIDKFEVCNRIRSWKKDNPPQGVHYTWDDLYRCAGEIGVPKNRVSRYWQADKYSNEEMVIKNSRSKIKEAIVNWRQKNPNGTKTECGKSIGCCLEKVSKYWDYQ